MPWTDLYMGIPFKPDGRDRNGLDCYGLICLIYKEQLGIEIPDYKGIFENNCFTTLKKVAQIIKEDKDKGWTVISKGEQKEFDGIVLRTGKFQWHLGVVVNSMNMIHIIQGAEVIVEPYESLLWKHRVAEFRRYSGRA